ncbi:hypothetical protein [Engelhardtia mirabilis]|uniref:Glycosyltransferase RgtA/B/C/D-like domain-containing protein n=1 Tax=Engelhardtia mirabilis TaxID=2528011 RepID=A0A518BJ25_9BACT|nr:hypothetical protein Pla133_20530 [Planctomycetes bacterium Pla133]QDV01304.1 hypothetical protein Pla86_20530 [Planctomycetes bacterium Pla86]
MSDPDQLAPPSPTPRAVWLVLGLIAVVLLVFTKDGPGSWADATRLATIDSLVTRGTLAIDDSVYVWQGDKVWFEPHFYSHQPPMMAMVGALPFALLHQVFGLAIDQAPTYRLLTLSLVGLPVLLGLWAISRLIAATGCRPGWNAALIASLGLATLLLPYSLVLNQHGTAAGLVALAFLCLQRASWISAGVLLALATTIDLTAVFPALACLWPVVRNSGMGGVVRYGIGALPVLALHFSVNWAVAGDLVPFGMHDEAFRYPMSPFMFMSLTGVDQVQAEGQRFSYLLGTTFGHSGLFSHHPQLLFAVAAGLLLLLRRRVADGAAKRSTQLIGGLLPAAALSAIGITVFYVFQSSNYGGSSFGMRWFAVFVPLLALFPAEFLARRDAEGRPWRPGPIAAPLLVVGLLISLAATALGAVNPWTKFHYRWADSPEGLAALPGEERPTPVQHWKTEWARIQRSDPINRQWYDQTFARLMDQHRRVYLRPLAGVDDTTREAWIRQGLGTLHAVVDLMDSADIKDHSRTMGHFWLGKFYAALEDKVSAEREYSQALYLNPGFGPAENALAKLREQ